MIARPPNWSSVPCQRYGTRRHPKAERCPSLRWPIKARNGATRTGNASIAATQVAEAPNSTIITRLSVPASNVIDMPTVI